MSTPHQKLKFSANSLEVRAEFNARFLRGLAEPPTKYLTLSEKKLKELQAKGQCASFKMYSERLKLVHEHIGKRVGLSDQRIFSVVLAQGRPELPGVSLEKVSTPGSKKIASLSIRAAAQVVQQWRPEWLRLWVEEEFARLKIESLSSSDQVDSALLRAQAGDPVIDFALTSSLPLEAIPEEKPYVIVVNRLRKDVSILLRDVSVLEHAPKREAIDKGLKQAIARIKEPGEHYEVFAEHSLARYRDALQGPAYLGFDLPFSVVLAGCIASRFEEPVDESDLSDLGANDGLGSAKKSLDAELVQKQRERLNEAGPFDLKVSKDGLRAEVSYFSPMAFKKASHLRDDKWVKKWLTRKGVRYGYSKEIKEAVAQAIAEQKSMQGMLLARGIEPGKHAGPYVVAVRPDTPPDEDDESAEDSEEQDSEDSLELVNLREQQNKSFCEEGEVVARLDFHERAKPGVNVYGKKIPVSDFEDMEVKLGELVERKGMKFYATAQGVASVGEDSVIVRKAYLHKGDVNLSSGNIDFDGSVCIQGSIDIGARVRATEDLVVRKNIHSGDVFVGGDLTVRHGIATAGKGCIRVMGHATSEYIENSVIECHGVLRVKKALLNSEVLAGEGIKGVRKRAIIAGGFLSCYGNFETGELGFQTGVRTDLQVGVPLKHVKSMRIRNKRVFKLEAFLDDIAAQLQELKKKSFTQVTGEQKDYLAQLKAKEIRVKRIIKTLQAQLKTMSQAIGYNRSSVAVIREALIPSCSIQVAGKTIPIPNEIAGVVLKGVRVKGSFVVTLEEWLEEQAVEMAAQGGRPLDTAS